MRWLAGLGKLLHGTRKRHRNSDSNFRVGFRFSLELHAINRFKEAKDDQRVKNTRKIDNGDIGRFHVENHTVNSRNPIDFTVTFRMISMVLEFDSVKAILENPTENPLEMESTRRILSLRPLVTESRTHKSETPQR